MVRRSLAIDQLPAKVREQIELLRGPEGRTWSEIEELSAEFVPWDKLAPEVRRLFPQRRIPHTNLHRWYDLRVEQVLQEAEERETRARAVAEQFAGKGVKELPKAIVNALTAKIFALMEASDAKSTTKMIGALTELGYLVATFEKIGIQAGKLGVEKEKLQLMAAKVKGLKNEVAKRKLAPAELQKKLDEIYGIVEAA